MKSLLDWLQHNKEWVFSGAGVTVFVGFVALVGKLLKSRASKSQGSSLLIRLGFGGLTYEGPPYMSDQMLLLSVANPSDRRVQLSGIHLQLKNATMIFFQLDGERRLPCMVDPGTHVKFWAPLSDVEDAIRGHKLTGTVKIRAIASDGVGNKYASDTKSLRV